MALAAVRRQRGPLPRETRRDELRVNNEARTVRATRIEM
jgi:hypothetical protein